MTKINNPRVFYDTIDWTIEQYHEMIEAGVLTENHKVELLYNKIVPMSPVGRFHAACVAAFQEVFIPKFLRKFSFRTQDPVAMLDHSEPEPDFVIANYRKDRYVNGHPGTGDILVLVEVSDTTLDKDQNFKKSVYASAAVREYWIVNLVERQIEVYTEPDAENLTYAKRAFHPAGSTFDHDLLGQIEVSELLPGITK